MTFTKETFCSYPWSTITLQPSGDFRVCCFANVNGDRGIPHDDEGKPMNILTHSIAEVLNSKAHKELRLAQSEGKRHIMCTLCWVRDDLAAAGNYHTNSMRVRKSFELFPDNDINKNAILFESAMEKMQPDGTIDPSHVVSLDLRFSNLCNMKCIMCYPGWSTLWYEDWEKLTGSKEFEFGTTHEVIEKEGKFKSTIIPWHDSPIWWNQFEQIKDKLIHIYLTGGETFLVPAHDELLDRLIESNLAKNIILEYDTNLSVINRKLLDRLKHFKRIILRISCDDIYERYEIIRFPGKFKRFVDNLKILEEIKESNIRIINISSMVGPYSIFSPLRLYDYFGYKYNINARITFLPEEYNIKFLPLDVKQKVIDIYEKSNLPPETKFGICNYLKLNIEISQDDCEKMTSRFIKRMDRLDEIRNTNWRKTFPEVIELLEDYI